MNTYANSIVNEFASKENRDWIYAEITGYFNGEPKVLNYLRDHLDDHVRHFSVEILQELDMSSPMPGTTVYDQLECFNNQFVSYLLTHISEHVYRRDQAPALYVVKDGAPTSSFGEKHYQQSADQILRSWYMNAPRSVQLREDTTGDIYSPTGGMYMGANGYGGGSISHGREILAGHNEAVKPTREHIWGSGRDADYGLRDGEYVSDDMLNQYREKMGKGRQASTQEHMLGDQNTHGANDRMQHLHMGYKGGGVLSDVGPRGSYVEREGFNPYRMSTGVAFCDQTDMGTSNHVEFYEDTTAKRDLNRIGLPHEFTPFGVSTPASDARLMQRRTFRSNEGHIENGIPRYESRLYNRYLERDISEGLRNTEKGCMIHGYDMSSLNARIDHKNHVRRMYEGPVHSQMFHNGGYAQYY